MRMDQYSHELNYKRALTCTKFKLLKLYYKVINTEMNFNTTDCGRL